MFVSSVRTYQFRNLCDATTSLAPGFVCVLGENGQGKTNLVEAISLVSFGRSFRTNDSSDLPRHGTKECSVFATVRAEGQNNGSNVIGIAIEEGKRSPLLNGNRCGSIAELFPMLRCVTFSPTDLSLLSAGPSERRRFFDRHTVDLFPELVWVYVEYQRALKSKQSLLRAASEGQHLSPNQLAPWNELLSVAGAKILNARTRLIALLEPIVARLSEQLFGKRDAIALRSRGPSGELLAERAGSELSPQELYRAFEEASEREIQRGRTLIGPHRDDLIPYMLGHDARSFASQGQSRSIVLVLKLGMVELIRTFSGESPVVLLDDVDSELDSRRREAIFSSMAEQSGQLIITATENRVPPSIASRIAQTLIVTEGAISSVG